MAKYVNIFGDDLSPEAKAAYQRMKNQQLADAALQAKLAAIKPRADLQKAADAAQKRQVAAQQKLAEYQAANAPSSPPVEEKQESGLSKIFSGSKLKMVLGVAAVGGVGYFAYKRFKK